MLARPVNASDAPAPAGSFSQAIDLSEHRRLLFVSGQIPVDLNVDAPDGFPAQCRHAWANVEAQLRAADMAIENLVKVTVFLADCR